MRTSMILGRQASKTRFVGRAAAALQAVSVLAMIAVSAGASYAGGDWNDKGVNWQPYDKGIAAAKEQNKPVCLVFYTETCPHCVNYSGVFHDAKVVEQSKKFVMIRLDRNKNIELSKQYAPDGEYIPRTYFLAPDGKLDPTIHAPRENYRYFYDERKPSGVLGGMDEALKLVK